MSADLPTLAGEESATNDTRSLSCAFGVAWTVCPGCRGLRARDDGVRPLVDSLGTEECGPTIEAAGRAGVVGKNGDSIAGTSTAGRTGDTSVGNGGGIPICFETAVTNDMPVVADTADIASSSRP